MPTTHRPFTVPDPLQVFHPVEVWRIRVYEAEKVIGAAKPLIFLSKALTLYKDKCQRIL
jgi:hypothetical protein